MPIGRGLQGLADSWAVERDVHEVVRSEHAAVPHGLVPPGDGQAILWADIHLRSRADIRLRGRRLVLLAAHLQVQL